MDKVGSFFRVFDLAFFAPGAVLFITLWHTSDLDHFDLSVSLSTATGLVAVTIILAAAYILGILCHAVQRLAYCSFGGKIVDALSNSNESPDKRTSWYHQLEKIPRDELAQYFWYMRATCWNLAVAIVLGSAYAEMQDKLTIPGSWVFTFVASVVLLFAGFDFHRAMRSLSSAKTSTSGSRPIEERS